MPPATIRRCGVLIPSTNTVVEREFATLRPKHISFHYARVVVDQPRQDSDSAFLNVMTQMAVIDQPIRTLLTCAPEHLVMGMSAPTFWGGLAGARALEERVEELSGVSVTTGSTALREALNAIGAKRISFFSPYQPVADREVTRYFRDCGIEISQSVGLKIPSARVIADVPFRVIVDTLEALSGGDVDAIVQVGTNLSMLQLASEAERWIGKTVIAINGAILWHALRALGSPERFDDFGALLRDY